MRNLLVLFTIERLSYDQALHAFSHACKLLIAKKWSGRVDLNHRPPGPEPVDKIT
jgi:hypothetical protein